MLVSTMTHITPHELTKLIFGGCKANWFSIGMCVSAQHQEGGGLSWSFAHWDCDKRNVSRTHNWCWHSPSPAPPSHTCHHSPLGWIAICWASKQLATSTACYNGTIASTSVDVQTVTGSTKLANTNQLICRYVEEDFLIKSKSKVR